MESLRIPPRSLPRVSLMTRSICQGVLFNGSNLGIDVGRTYETANLEKGFVIILKTVEVLVIVGDQLRK